MIFNYTQKDFNYLIEFFISNKTILICGSKKSKMPKLVNKILSYFNYLGLIVSSSYKIKIYVRFSKKEAVYKTVELTKKI